MSAWVHGFCVIVDKCLFGGGRRRDVEVEGGMTETRFGGTGRWPAKLPDGGRCI